MEINWLGSIFLEKRVELTLEFIYILHSIFLFLAGVRCLVLIRLGLLLLFCVFLVKLLQFWLVLEIGFKGFILASSYWVFHLFLIAINQLLWYWCRELSSEILIVNLFFTHYLLHLPFITTKLPVFLPITVLFLYYIYIWAFELFGFLAINPNLTANA